MYTVPITVHRSTVHRPLTGHPHHLNFTRHALTLTTPTHADLTGHDENTSLRARKRSISLRQRKPIRTYVAVPPYLKLLTCKSPSITAPGV